MFSVYRAESWYLQLYPRLNPRLEDEARGANGTDWFYYRKPSYLWFKFVNKVATRLAKTQYHDSLIKGGSKSLCQSGKDRL